MTGTTLAAWDAQPCVPVAHPLPVKPALCARSPAKLRGGNTLCAVVPHLGQKSGHGLVDMELVDGRFNLDLFSDACKRYSKAKSGSW